MAHRAARTPLVGTRRLGHVPELDSLRGVALLLVLGAHLFIIWPTWVLESTFSGGGFLGVDLFFVLSGFLITALLLEEEDRSGRIRVGAFLWRRALRLLPALWLLLAAHLVYAVIDGYPPFGQRSTEWSALRASALFHMNWHVLWHPLETADLTPLWSVAIEVQFYAVWPLVVLALLSLRRNAAVGAAALGALFVAISVWRLQVFDRHGWEAAYLRSDAHVEGLVLGALVACAWIRGWTPDRLPRPLLWVALAVLGVLVTQLHADERATYAGGTTLYVAAAAVAVLTIVTNRRPLAGPVAHVTALLGRWSYGIYLWHFPVLWAVTRDGMELGNGGRLAWATGITAAGVVASRYLVELPALRLKDRGRLSVGAGARPTAA